MNAPLVDFNNLTPEQEYRFAQFLQQYLKDRFEHFVRTNLIQLKGIRLFPGDAVAVNWSLNVKAEIWQRLLYSEESIGEIVLEARWAWADETNAQDTHDERASKENS